MFELNKSPSTIFVLKIKFEKAAMTILNAKKIGLRGPAARDSEVNMFILSGLTHGLRYVGGPLYRGPLRG